MANQTSISITPVLERLKNNLHDVSFSQRVSEITERYEAIIALTPVPSLDDEEIAILSEALCGSVISFSKIKYLHEEILLCSVENAEKREALAKKVESWTAAEKIAVIEKFGL